VDTEFLLVPCAIALDVPRVLGIDSRDR